MRILFTYCPENEKDELFGHWIASIKERMLKLSPGILGATSLDIETATNLPDTPYDLTLPVLTDNCETNDWVLETLSTLSKTKAISIILKKDSVTGIDDQLTPFLIAPLYKENEDILHILEKISLGNTSYPIPSYHLLQLILDFTYHQVSVKNENAKKVYLSYVGEEYFENFLGLANELNEKGFQVATFPFTTSSTGQELAEKIFSIQSTCDYIVQFIGYKYQALFKNSEEHFNYIECQVSSSIYSTLLEEYSDFTEVPYNRITCVPVNSLDIDDKQLRFIDNILSKKHLLMGSRIFKGTSFEMKEYALENVEKIDLSFKDLDNLDIDDSENEFYYIISNPKNRGVQEEIENVLRNNQLKHKIQPVNFYNGSNKEHLSNIVHSNRVFLIGVNESLNWIMSNASIIRKHRLTNNKNVNISVVTAPEAVLPDKELGHITYDLPIEEKILDAIFVDNN